MKSLKELLAAKAALDAEVEARMAKVPVVREVKAIVALVAEKYGFELDLSNPDCVPDIRVSNAIVYYQFAQAKGVSKDICYFNIKCDSHSSDVTPDEFIKAAEGITRAANFAKEIQDKVSVFKYHYTPSLKVAEPEASGIILESGDENLIAKYAEVLKAEIAEFKEKVSVCESDTTDKQNEIKSLKNPANKTRNRNKKIEDCEFWIDTNEKEIKKYQKAIDMRRKELEEIENLNAESKVA